MTLRLSIENVDRLPDGGPDTDRGQGDEGSISAAIRTSIGPCLTQAEASRASTARFAIATADTGFTTSRQTGPSSTAPSTGSTRRTSCGTGIAWASGPTSSPFRSKKDERRRVRPRRRGLVRRWSRRRLGSGRGGRSAGNRRPTPGGADARRSAGFSRFCFVPRGAETCPGAPGGPGRDPRTIG